MDPIVDPNVDPNVDPIVEPNVDPDWTKIDQKVDSQKWNNFKNRFQITKLWEIKLTFFRTNHPENNLMMVKKYPEFFW